SPEDGISTPDNTPTFSWTAVSDISSPVTYHLQVDNDPDFSSPEIDLTGILENTYTPATGLPEENYSWKVRAVDNAGNEGSWSSVWTFQIDTGPPPVPEMLSPAGTVIDNTPTFIWGAVTDPSLPVRYDLQVDNDPGFTSPEISVTYLTNTEYTHYMPLYEEIYYWRVRARDGVGNASQWSTPWEITVDGTPPRAPTLVYPSYGENTRDNIPNFDWNPVSDMSTPVVYRVYVDDDPNFTSVDYDSNWTTDDFYQVPSEMTEGVWYWKVQAKDSLGNEGENSATSWFRIDVTPPSTRPSLISPANGDNITDNTPLLSWTGVTDISLPVVYKVFIAADPQFESLVYESEWISGTSHVPSEIPDGTIYWRVGTKDNAGNIGENSDARWFQLDATPPAPPPLTYPDDEEVMENTPVLVWSQVGDAHPPVMYRCQVSSDPDFMTVDYDSGWIYENSYAPPALSSGGWYWRVQARDNWNNVGAYSTRSFDIGVPIWFQGMMISPENTPQNVTINLYSRGKLSFQIHPAENGEFRKKIYSGAYDLEVVLSSIRIKFENLRSFENGQTHQTFENLFSLDNFHVSVTPISGTKARLFAFSVKEGPALSDNYERVTLTFDYTPYISMIDNVYALTFYRCSNWNFETRSGDGNWTRMGGTVNTVARTLTLMVSSFSAYVVAEDQTGMSLEDIVDQLQDSLGGLGGTVGDLSKTVDDLSGALGSLGQTVTGLEGAIEGLGDIVENLPLREPLVVTPSSVSISMYEGEISNLVLSIKNNLSSSQTVTARISDGDGIDEFISFGGIPVTIGPGETGAIELVVYVPMNTRTAVYSGTIILESENVRVDVPTAIRVLARKRNLLDLKVTPLNYEVSPGGVLQVEVYLYNMGDEPKVDTNVLLQLIDPRTMENVAQVGEALAVETAMTKTIPIPIPEHIEEKTYYVRATAEYLMGAGRSVQVVSVASVEVRRPPIEVTFFGLPIATLIIALVASGTSALVGVMIYRWEKKKSKSKKRFEEVVAMSEIPQEGPDSAWVGHLAETRRKAFVNLDDLKMHVMIAGATGSGKTITAQTIVEEALLHGKNVIVFDPTAQWTGFLRKCREKTMLKHYGRFGMSESDARGFPGRIKMIRDPRERVNMKELLGEEMRGKITIFLLEGLEPGDMDIFVANTIQDVFRSQPAESEKLKILIVYDELHRLLPRFGGTGGGILHIERGIREFRKWGIGLVLSSQVVSDFEKEIRANIRTQIQMWTRDEEELARITEKFGVEHMQSISKAPVGYGMIVNSDYNRGRPYYVNFRPILHQVSRLTPDELKRYYEADERVEDVKFKVRKLEEKGVDTFDVRVELDLAEKKLEEGAFDMVDLYLESLEPGVERLCEKHGLKGIKRERGMITEAELKKAEMEAIEERKEVEEEEKEKPPEIVEAYREILAPAAEIMKVKEKIKPFEKKKQGRKMGSAVETAKKTNVPTRGAASKKTGKKKAGGKKIKKQKRDR
ncbi:MAG: Ig-like domain-containing protein, partial [Candidatus Hadarchaeales archaeon]